MGIRIEDAFVDIISKARAGQGISQADIVERTGLSVGRVRELFKGEGYSDADAEKLAAVLGLNSHALKAAHPEPIDPGIDASQGLHIVNTPYPLPGYAEMTVNAYVVHPPGSGEALVIDGGAKAAPLLDCLRQASLRVAAVFLTHTHGDHIQALPEIRRVADSFPTYVHEKEAQPGAETITPPAQFEAAGLQVRALETAGHSPGGTTYSVKGLDKPLAFVGDALFCGSVGGIREDYERALEQIRTNILTLPDETILCPGHGPLTTVAHEKQTNPFFAEG